MPGLIAVLDGVSMVDGIESGCLHSPAWYASRLAANLGTSFTASPRATLADILAQAIERVCAEHGGTCDLRHPGTPQSTVAMLRIGDEECDYLLLSDSTLVLDCSGAITAVTDPRVRDVAQSQRRLAFSGAGSIGSPARTDHLHGPATGGEPGPTEEASAVRWWSAERVAAEMDEAFAVRILDALRPDRPPAVRTHDGVRLLD